MKRTRITPYVFTAAALAAFGVSLVAHEAQAISRYTSTSMSCSSVKATVKAQGAVILRWTSAQGNPRHGRYVASTGYCDPGERAVTAYVPSSDKKSCAVKTCKHCDPFKDDDDGFLRFRPC
jgi:hypothetical protein